MKRSTKCPNNLAGETDAPPYSTLTPVHIYDYAASLLEPYLQWGVKRCRIVKDVLRLTKDGISDLVMEIACGLHNLRVSCRHPLPAFDLLSLVDSS